MAEFASRGVGAAGLTTGIIGTSLGALNSGILGNLFGNANGNANAHGACDGAGVNRYEMQLQQRIAALESGIALRDANIYNDAKALEMYKYIDGKIEGINARLAEQAVFNATATSTMNCIAGQVNQLFGLTKLVVPNASVCPGFGNVTITPAAASTTTTAAII